MGEVNGGELEGHEVHVGDASAAVNRTVAHAENVGEGEVHDWFSRCHGGHCCPGGVVHHVAGKLGDLRVWGRLRPRPRYTSRGEDDTGAEEVDSPHLQIELDCDSGLRVTAL